MGRCVCGRGVGGRWRWEWGQVIIVETFSWFLSVYSIAKNKKYDEIFQD